MFRLSSFVTGLICGDKGVDMRIKRSVMKEYAVPCPAFKGGSYGDGDGFAGGVANSHHDLQPE